MIRQLIVFTEILDFSNPDFYFRTWALVCAIPFIHGPYPDVIFQDRIQFISLNLIAMNLQSLTRAATIVGAVAILALSVNPARLSAGDPGTKDWPMWGGTPDRNMVSKMTGLPTEWDVKTKKNVKWVADLGSQSYGNPVVAGGMVFVGTNNELMRDKAQAGDRGVLMAFDEKTGDFLWQQTSAKLESGRANDWPFQGVASSPLVEGEKLYYVTNRAVLVCLEDRKSVV